MRSVLTMLGIIIGIAAIIIIVSIIGAASAELKNEMVGDSTNNVNVALYEKNNDMYYYAMEYDADTNGALSGVDKISDEKFEQVKELPGISSAARVYSRDYGRLQIKYLGKTAYAATYGIDEDYFAISERVLISGRLITDDDYKKKNNVAVIDDSAANTLFKNEEAIGKTVQVGNELFTVVGVVMKVVDYSEVENLADYYMKTGFVDSSVYVPYTSWTDVVGYDDIQKMVIKVDDPDQIVSAATEAANVLNKNLPTTDYEYKSGSLTEDADSLKQITNIASILLIGIASISLIVGGIGVMNIMLVSVTERTREIGLKKALGARRRVILGQFLTESVVLTSLGGLIGVLIGIGVSKLVGMVIEMPAVISVGAIAISVGFSMGIGIIFGLVPSIKAANLDPIEALRYE